MIRQFICNNINGVSLGVKEESLNWIINITDVVAGECVSITLPKATYNLKNILEAYAHTATMVGYSVVDEGQVFVIEYDSEVGMTKVLLEDRQGNSIFNCLTRVQLNTLIEFTRHAISNYNVADDSFYLNVYTTGLE